MIGSLTGSVKDIDLFTVLIDVNGVGYEVECTEATLRKLEIGGQVSLVIFTDVREDAIVLFGFADKSEKQVFLLLQKVKGVGARTASQIISRIDKVELLRIIGAGDLTRLQSVRGIGKKLAERIIVELKDLVADHAMGRQQRLGSMIEVRAEPYQDAISALEALGFSKRDAERAVAEVRNLGGSLATESGSIVKEALRFI